MEQEFRHESSETQARNECLVLEALAELKHASAKAIAKHAGLTYLSTLLAIRRQDGFCVERVTGGWRLLEEPGDRNVSFDSRIDASVERREQIERQIEFYLSDQNLEVFEFIFCHQKVICLVNKPASDVAVGDWYVAVRKQGKCIGTRFYRHIYKIYRDDQSDIIRFELSGGKVSIPSPYFSPQENVLIRIDFTYENGKITPR